MFNISKWIKRRNTVRELNRLTDRDLSDIGLTRCDLKDWVNRNM